MTEIENESGSEISEELQEIDIKDDSEAAKLKKIQDLILSINDKIDISSGDCFKIIRQAEKVENKIDGLLKIIRKV